jgi:hypothetical protein
MTDVIKKECLEISGQDAYRQIWSETNLGGSGAGRQGERWWGHADRIEAKKAEVEVCYIYILRRLGHGVRCFLYIS